jgi:WD40 repeat protein
MVTRKQGLLAAVLTAVGAASVLAQEPRRDLYGDPLPPGAVARIGTVRLRTPREISRIALSADGKLLVTSDDSLPLKVWDAATGVLIREVPPPPDVQAARGAPARVRIATMAFPADARRWLHVLTEDGILRECDVTDGTWNEPLARTEVPGDDWRSAGGRVSPDRTHFLYTPFDGKFKGIEVFAVGKRKPVLRIEDPGFGQYGRASSVSADNGLLAAVLEDRTAKVWDLKTGKPVATHAAPDGVFYSAAVSPDGKSLAAVCGPKGRIGIPPPAGTFLYGWDPATGKGRFRTPESLFVTYSQDGSRLIGFAGDDVLVADPPTGKLVHRLRGHGSWMIAGYAFSADGKRLVTSGQDHSAIIWDLAAGKPALDFDSPRGAVNVLAFSPDGKTLFAGCSDDRAGGLWDAETGKRKHQLVADKKGSPLCAAFTPDGRHVVVGYGGAGTDTGKDWAARLWSVADGKLVREFGGHTDGVHELVISPDGKQVATWDWGSKVRLWEIATGRAVKEADWAPYNAASALAYPRAGELVGVKFDRANAWEAVNLISGKTLGRGTENGNGSRVPLSPDGRLAVTIDGPKYDRVTVRDADRGSGPGLVIPPARQPFRNGLFTRRPDGRRQHGPRRGRRWSVRCGHRPRVEDSPGAPGADRRPGVQPGRQAAGDRRVGRHRAGVGPDRPPVTAALADRPSRMMTSARRAPTGRARRHRCSARNRSTSAGSGRGPASSRSRTSARGGSSPTTV